MRRSNVPLHDVQADYAAGPQAALRRHEAIMAELLWVSSAREETSPAETPSKTDDEIHCLIAELAVQWEEVRIPMGYAAHSPVDEER